MKQTNKHSKSEMQSRVYEGSRGVSYNQLMAGRTCEKGRFWAGSAKLVCGEV